MPLQQTQAAFVTNEDARGRKRRTLRLQSEALTSTGAAAVLIRNISETGILIETEAELAVEEIVEVDLPEVGRREATIAWGRQNLFGCVFVDAIPTGGVSAALLRSLADTPNPGGPLERSGPESSPSSDTQPESPELSLRAKAWTIAGLAVLAWAFVGLVVFAFASGMLMADISPGPLAGR